MTEAQALEAICERVTDATLGWPALAPGIPLVLPNEALPSATSFAQLTVQYTTSTPITMGTPKRYQRKGWIYVKLWGPTNAGAKALASLADVTRQILESASLGVSGDPVTILGGLTQVMRGDAKWANSVVQFPFYFFEQK